MDFVWLYFAVLAFACLWVTVDKDARGAFECLSKMLHSTARSMGIYGQFLCYSAGRLLVLLTLVLLAVSAAFGVLHHNPLGLSPNGRGLIFVGMILGAAAITVLPWLASRLRFARLLRSVAAEFEDMVVSLPLGQERSSHWDVAQYDTTNGWTAWHPKQATFERDGVWSAIVPLFFVGSGTQPSVMYPIDFEYFLAWRLPNDLKPGDTMPFFAWKTDFLVKSVTPLRGRPGWSVVRADMELEDIDELAA